MSAREALAAAVDDVEGIAGHPYISNDTKPGTAFVRFERTDYPDRFGGIDHWNVIVVLPQDQGEAERFLEDRRHAIRAALKPVLVVTSVRRARLDITGVGVLPCAFFNGHREA